MNKILLLNFLLLLPCISWASHNKTRHLLWNENKCLVKQASQQRSLQSPEDIWAYPIQWKTRELHYELSHCSGMLLPKVAIVIEPSEFIESLSDIFVTKPCKAFPTSNKTITEDDEVSNAEEEYDNSPYGKLNAFEEKILGPENFQILDNLIWSRLPRDYSEIKYISTKYDASTPNLDSTDSQIRILFNEKEVFTKDTDFETVFTLIQQCLIKAKNEDSYLLYDFLLKKRTLYLLLAKIKNISNKSQTKISALLKEDFENNKD